MDTLNKGHLSIKNSQFDPVQDKYSTYDLLNKANFMLPACSLFGGSIYRRHVIKLQLTIVNRKTVKSQSWARL